MSHTKKSHLGMKFKWLNEVLELHLEPFIHIRNGQKSNRRIENIFFREAINASTSNNVIIRQPTLQYSTAKAYYHIPQPAEL